MITAQNATANPVQITDPFALRLASLWKVDEELRAKLADCKTYDDYVPIVLDELLRFDSHSRDAFHRFYGLSKHISAGMVIRLACELILPTYSIDKPLFCEMLGCALANESPEDKAEREAFVRDALKDNLMPNGKVRLYRGATKESAPVHSAFSYTTSKEKAEWFKHRNELIHRQEGDLIVKDFPLGKIIWYTNCREEQEAVVIPPYLQRYINDALAWHDREAARNVS